MRFKRANSIILVKFIPMELHNFSLPGKKILDFGAPSNLDFCFRSGRSIFLEKYTSAIESPKP